MHIHINKSNQQQAPSLHLIVCQKYKFGRVYLPKSIYLYIVCCLTPLKLTDDILVIARYTQDSYLGKLYIMFSTLELYET